MKDFALYEVGFADFRTGDIWYIGFIRDIIHTILLDKENNKMGLFNKMKKQNGEKNEINNKVLKERLANAALQMLTEGEDYDQLAYTMCEFGYLFEIDGHGLEALFKIKTDKDTFYFAAQKNSLLKLDLNEELFKGTTDTFLSLHQ